jgi:glycosyltransferase involved in cell wall biosynthesis|tara:strand:- start:9165 stop:11489 length:2325 start_codon:yes stop_codon:yes gene_type:complete
VKRIAFVIPWFGRNLKGGAEQQAWQAATRLARRGHEVEVLTTCCRSFFEDWSSNHFSAGTSHEHGLNIHRFPVDRRDHKSFDRMNRILLKRPFPELKAGVPPISWEHSDAFVKENINSTLLTNYLRVEKDSYHAFIFIPYLYGLTINGLPIVAERAFLQPCLHDEAYAYLAQVERIFHSAKGILFISEGEQLLAQRLYGPGICQKSFFTGGGVEMSDAGKNQIDKIGSLRLDNSRFILCLGRRDPAKNTDFIVEAYARFKEQNPCSDLQLILAGPGTGSFGGRIEGVVDLGLVKDDEKNGLIANCLALFQPSRNESYSRAMMEAWFHGRPVVAHRDCLATATAVQCAKGGWLAGTLEEWSHMFAEINRQDKKQIAGFGENGRCFAKENADWEKVIDRYEKAIYPSDNCYRVAMASKKLNKIHQLIPNLAYGDAISNHAMVIRDYLRCLGYRSEIFVKHLDQRIAHEASIFNQNTISAKAGMLYHHSIGSEITIFAVNHPGPKCLIYHNITPPEFFEPFWPDFASILKKGRDDLKKLSGSFTISVGDSAYNASELEASSFDNPGVLPIAVCPAKWSHLPNTDLMRRLQDGKTNLLFVGRIVPNKRQDQLVETFSHYLTMDSDARLIIVGQIESGNPYHDHLLDVIAKHGLRRHVLVTGLVSDSALQAYYRTAHLFWSMSEHEGFCIPLIEAMWFDVPVLAYNSAAAPETLGQAGIMFNHKGDLVRIAALAKLVVHDGKLKKKILKAQRSRRTDFLPEKVLPGLNKLISQMEEQIS